MSFTIDELPTVIAGAPREQLLALMAQLAACQSAVAARLLNGQHAPVERRMSSDEDGAS